MNVTIKFSEDIIKTMDINLAWEMFYLYQQGAKMAGEKITPQREYDWSQVELDLQSANEGDTIDFTRMGDIYYTNGGPYLNDNAD